jgi:hypothetical protein
MFLSSVEFFNCLRKISKETKIMDEPELLSMEAQWSYAGKSTSSLDVKMEADHPVVDQALSVTNSPAPLTSHSNMWANSVMTTSCELTTACSFVPQVSSLMTTSIMSDNCVLSHNLTDAVMSTDSQDLHLGPISDIPLLTCDTEMSIVDSFLNNLEHTDSFHHLLTDQPISFSDITPTPITEADIAHSQTPYTQAYTLQHNHQNPSYPL